ncbi:hypothetical protein [Staphylococcus capitis]|uniref:hypothetical protein n=1 Tax=Staphylococcus capitis TaxID=29388 RepID=UPI003CF5B0A9
MEEKHLLTEEEIRNIRREIFKNNGKVVIPRGVITYLKNKKMSVSTKGKILYAYIGIILCYHNAYHTYRKHHMHLSNILDVMNIGWSKLVRKEFTKSGFFEKEGYITHQNYLPLWYELSKTKSKDNKEVIFANHKTTNDLTRDELLEKVNNYENRYKICIEPTLHIYGKKVKKGRGYQIKQQPLNIEPVDYIMFDLKTIEKVLTGELSSGALFYIAYLKGITGNNNITDKDKFKTSISQIAVGLDITEITARKFHKEIGDNFGKKYYKLNQVTKKYNGGLISIVYLNLSREI